MIMILAMTLIRGQEYLGRLKMMDHKMTEQEI